ncbi:MAG: RNA polymerase sigma factor [Opitutaceae bacterium]|nr:RNA polymerase sigma factor [Opitutaceae bacterium]
MSPQPSSTPSAPAVPGLLPAVERSWFDEQVQSHEPVLRAYLQRKFPQLPDIDDVVQESLLRTWKARAMGRLRSARGFLFTTARHAALDVFRHRAAVPMEPLTELTAANLVSEEANAAEVASRNQELELLMAALADLPDRCRQIFILRRIKGLSHREISTRLGIAEGTIEKQVGIALKKCVTYLQLRGVEIRRR